MRIISPFFVALLASLLVCRDAFMPTNFRRTTFELGIREKYESTSRGVIDRKNIQLLSSSSTPMQDSDKTVKFRVDENASKERLDELRVLLSDITNVIVSTGFRSGLTRSIQVATAINVITREFIANPNNFRDQVGNFNIPKILKRMFEELGATYIKLGQFIASSPTLFPAEYVLEFQSCLDNSPTIPFDTIKRIIAEELKRPISSVYLSIDPVPLASASIAQVHRAKLRNGEEVVIKVRKPGVESTLKADLGFLLISSKLIELVNPSLARLSLSNIVGDLRESMLDELDFRKESNNLVNFRSFLDKMNIRDAVAPFPYPEATTKRILTMEYLRGVPLVDLEGIRKYSANPEATLISALRTWSMSVTQNDVFHADVHGGNLLVLENGKIGFIDFGIVGKVSEKVWNAVGSLIQSLVLEDYQGMAQALVDMGATKSKVDIQKFAEEIEIVVKRITSLQPEVKIITDGTSVGAQIAIDDAETTKIVLEIVGVAENNGLKLPREFGLLLKQALYFDRYQKLLAPTLDPLRDSRVRESFNNEMNISSGNNNNKDIFKKPPSIIDVEIV